MEAPVQSDQIVNADKDPIVSVENDELKGVKNDQTVSTENDKSVSVDNEQMLIVEGDQSVSVVNDQLTSAEIEQGPIVEGDDQLAGGENDATIASVKNNPVASDENDQRVSIENDKLVSGVDDQMLNVENDQSVSVANDQLANVENKHVHSVENDDQLASVENDQKAIVENNQLMSHENDQTVSSGNDQTANVENVELVNADNDQMLTVGNDQAASVDNDEVASVENEQVPGVENADQLASAENDRKVSLENNLFTSGENAHMVSTEDDQVASVEADKSTSVVNDQMLIVPNDESSSADKDQVASLENEQVPNVENADQFAKVENYDQIASVENNQLVVSTESDQIASVENDQRVSIENDKSVSVVNDHMLIAANDESASVDNDQVMSIENEQVPSVENDDQLASVEKEQIATVDNTQLVRDENDQMLHSVENANDESASVDNNQVMNVENEQVPSVKNDDQLASVEKAQIGTVDNTQLVRNENENDLMLHSVENDHQMVSVENNQLVNDENDQMDCTEHDQIASVENDQKASDENEHFVSVANDQTIGVENGQMVSFENYQIVHDENDQMVSLENNHLTAIENDDLANMDTDELVNMDDHHHQLVTIAENHQLVGMENNNLLVPFQNDQLEPLEYNALAIMENDQLDDMETPMPKRRKKKSTVWEHFTIENVSAGCRRACCKQCKQSFAYSTGSKVAGTSHLKRHVAKGTCSVLLRHQAQMFTNEINNENNNNNTPYSAPSKMGITPNGTDPPKRRYRTAASVPYMGFDPDRCRQEISRMIIMHDYPLHIVEHKGFVAFVKSLQPRFDMVSFNTVQSDCLATYTKEKQALQKAIEVIPGRICLTLDMWASNLTTGYIFLTGSYIDTDWKLHRKLLNVVMEPYPESDSAFSHAVASCLSDWNMEGKLFTLTLNQPLSEGSIDNLRSLLSIKNPLMLNGQLLVGNCLAQSLSSVARVAFIAAADTVKKVRDSVKYVKLSESREEKFLELKQQLQVPSTKLLALDDRTKWNTTYEMLLAASELREVFSCLDTSDPDYREAPSLETWKQVDTLLVFLKTLFETASYLTSPTTPTTNFYFNEVWKIELEFVRAVQSEDPFMSSLARAMKEKFDEYWKSCSLVLAVAVVMDPRFKMKLVEFSFSKIYGEDAATYVKLVNDGIHELYLEYVTQPLPLTPTFVESGHVQGGLPELGLTDFDVYIMESTSQQSRSELDQYLEESLLPRVHEFDVLGWWKINKTKYPTLSKMARDILTTSVCTVGPGSVFNTERREMDNYRCSLRPDTVEAVICAKDWLKSAPVENLNSPVKMEFPI